jgi:hypothetical protein
MPGTKRVPVTRSPIPQITLKAVELFDGMRGCRCTCPPIDWEGKYWGRQQCPGCKRWWELQNQLCDELCCKPWEYPCVEDPRTQNPYPRGMPAHQSWQPNHRAQEMWRTLADASREAKREERAARRAKGANDAPDQPPAT